MNDTRGLAQRYMDLLCSQKFADAFDLLAVGATYQIIGKTAVSKELRGRDAVKSMLVPALASFQKPPELKLRQIVVEGNCAVALASGFGVGPTGLPYDQPFYAMALWIEGGEIQRVEEYADTVELEVALMGKKLVPA